MESAFSPLLKPKSLISTHSSVYISRFKQKTRNLPPIRSISSLFGNPKPNPKSSPPPTAKNYEFAIDVEEIAEKASAKLRKLRKSTDGKIRRFISSGKDAYHDLRTSIRVERDRKIIFSCNKSSLIFVSDFLIWSLISAVIIRVVLWSWVWLRRNWGFGDWRVVRRDRSLGGREVVVGRLANPLSPVKGSEKERRKSVQRVVKVVSEENLPEWWPISATGSSVNLFGREDLQKEANRLVRAITENRMSGRDYREDDIIQLRQICRMSSARVSFDTVNSRDSFYRASVEFVLKACSRAPGPSSEVHIDGENVRNFIAGLAGDIGIENTRAIRILRGAVAAKTRSHVLQSWALEVQGRRHEATDELVKLCGIFRIFPLEPYSAEMEMVAVGLRKSLTTEQRVHILNIFGQACGPENRIMAAAALGLNNFAETRLNGDGMRDFRASS